MYINQPCYTGDNSVTVPVGFLFYLIGGVKQTSIKGEDRSGLRENRFFLQEKMRVRFLVLRGPPSPAWADRAGLSMGVSPTETLAE